LIRILAALASRTSLQDSSGYGSRLRKFHLFCDIFSIPEEQRLPASFDLLHSFALCLRNMKIPFSNSRLASSARMAPLLSDDNHNRIQWLLRGPERIQAQKCSRPPITLRMLSVLKGNLNLSSPFDACVWAMASCAFWGMMCFGEVSVTTWSAFNPSRNLKRRDAHLDYNMHNKRYMRLDLPAAKTAKPGQIQSVFLTEQSDLCPIEALISLSLVVPAGPNEPLFSWRDIHRDIHPMVKICAIDRINSILNSHGWGNSFRHSFRIGGASYYLAQKVDPEIVRLAGRWKSLAYEAYIRAFEQIT
ncbi:hypothetical protein K439DRAFT_1556198, partial [Ramaria rubella]